MLERSPRILAVAYSHLVSVVIRMDVDGEHARLAPTGSFELAHTADIARAVARAEHDLDGRRDVVLGHALGVPGLPVDRHVLRVSNRIGIARGEDPVAVEQQLCAAMPKAKWTKTSDTLIIHGRRICKPKPLCDQCAVREDCDHYRKVVSKTPTNAPTKVQTKAKTR